MTLDILIVIFAKITSKMIVKQVFLRGTIFKVKYLKNLNKHKNSNKIKMYKMN